MQLRQRGNFSPQVNRYANNILSDNEEDNLADDIKNLINMPLAQSLKRSSGKGQSLLQGQQKLALTSP